MHSNSDQPKQTASGPVPRPPIAPGQCIFGNTFQFMRDTTGLLLNAYRNLGPIYRLRALWLKYTVIGGFEARDFMRAGLDDLHLTREAVFAEVGRQLGAADFVLGQSGEKHTQLRRVLALAYSREVASPWVPEMIRAIEEESRSWTTDTRICVMDFVQKASFEQYCRVLCGTSLGAHYRDCLRVTDYNMNVGGRVWPFFMYRMPTYRASRRRVLELMWTGLKERKKTPNTASPPTIMDTLIRLRDGNGRPLTDDEVVCYSMYGFAGSSSYMGRLVAFLLFELFRHPEERAAIVKEVDQAFAQGINHATDVRGLVRLQAFYHETLRFHPVSQGMPHLASHDFEFQSYQVKKGDLVVLSQVPMNFSACPFHQPERFDPERCLEPRNEHRRGNAFHPFGIGHRTCTATGLVELLTLTQIATLLHKFELEMDPADYQLKLRVRPLPAPDNRFHFRIVRRRTPSDEPSTESSFREDLVLADVPAKEDPVVQAFLQESTRQSIPANAILLNEGDLADAFYVLIRGSARVTRRINGEEQWIAELSAGAYFGEIGLLQSGIRTATVTAGPNGAEVCRVEAETFRELVHCSDLVSTELSGLIQRRMANQQLLETFPSRSLEQLRVLLPEFRHQSFAPSAVVLKEGEPSDAFYLLLKGEVRVLRATGPETQEEVTRLGPGSYFGETGLLTNRPRNATIQVSDEASIEVLATDRKGFDALLAGNQAADGSLAQALLQRLESR